MNRHPALLISRLLLFPLLAALLCACPAVPPPETCKPKEPAPLPPQRFDPAGMRAAPEAPADRRQRIMGSLGEVDAHLEKALESNGFPGLAVGLVYQGQTIWTTGLGSRDLAQGDPITHETVFRLGSVTKVVTGLALLLLRDKGLLNFDDPVARLVPEMAQVVYPTSDSPRITVRHLVTHTSGIPRMGSLDYYSRANRSVTEDELLSALKGLQLEFVPGTKTQYSNLAMGIAGLVVARAAGVSYRDFVSKEILVPLGMVSATWDHREVPADRLATGYKLHGNMHVRDHHWQFGASEALGGLYASLADVCRFASWQLRAWPPRSEPDNGPVARATVRESHLSAGYARPGGQSFGVNWAVQNHPELGWVVSHTGGTFLYGATVWLLPERQVGLVMLTNTGGTEGKAAFALAAVAQEVLGIVMRHESGRSAERNELLEAAVARAKALVNAPDANQVTAQFSETFLKALPQEKVLEFLRKAGESLGTCTGHELVRNLSPHAATFKLRCQKGTADLTLHVEAEKPNKFSGFAMRNVTIADAPPTK